MVSTAIIENVVVITGIRFRPAGRIYYFDPQGQSYTTGQYVIVETVRGVEAGRVVIASKKMAESDLSDPLKPILRLATEDELRMMLSFKSKEKEALVKCAERVAQHALPMKLVESEYTFDGSRLTFYFTADERVDFRALVRDLAAAFRTRIELRQIGARDQANAAKDTLKKVQDDIVAAHGKIPEMKTGGMAEGAAAPPAGGMEGQGTAK